MATAVPRTARVATWLAAALAVGSVPLHAWMQIAHSHGVVLTTLMAAMVLWCLWCAVGAVLSLPTPALLAPSGSPSRPPPYPASRPRQASVRHLWLMAQAMSLLHVVLLTGFPGGGHHHTVATAGTMAGAGSDGAGPDVGPAAGTGPMLAIVVLELAVCFACAVALRARARGRSPADRQHLGVIR